MRELVHPAVAHGERPRGEEQHQLAVARELEGAGLIALDLDEEPLRGDRLLLVARAPRGARRPAAERVREPRRRITPEDRAPLAQEWQPLGCSGTLPA